MLDNIRNIIRYLINSLTILIKDIGSIRRKRIVHRQRLFIARKFYSQSRTWKNTGIN